MAKVMRFRSRKKWWFRVRIPSDQFYWKFCFASHISETYDSSILTVTGSFDDDEREQFDAIYSNLPYQIRTTKEYWENMDLFYKQKWVSDNTKEEFIC